MEGSSDEEKPTYTGLPALLIGRAGRCLLRQQENLRRPGEEAGPARCVRDESGGRVARRGRGFRRADSATPSPPRRPPPRSPPATPPPSPPVQLSLILADEPIVAAEIGYPSSKLPTAKGAATKPAGAHAAGLYRRATATSSQRRGRRVAADAPSRQQQARLLELWPFWSQLGGLPTTVATLLPHVRASGFHYRHVPELLRGMGSPAIKGAPLREAPTGGAAAKRGQRLKKKKIGFVLYFTFGCQDTLSTASKCCCRSYFYLSFRRPTSQKLKLAI